MTDWATRASTPEHPLREMQSPQSDVDIDETIAAIRRVVEENRHMLPPDVVPAEAAGAELLPAMVTTEDIGAPRKFGLLAALTAAWR